MWIPFPNCGLRYLDPETFFRRGCRISRWRRSRALGEESVILELSRLSAAGQGVSTGIVEAAALAHVCALSNVEREGVMAAEEPLELPGCRKPVGGPGVRRGRLQLS
jgi:hypothetical protein